MSGNPYRPSVGEGDAEPQSSSSPDGRFVFLLLPPLIPLAVHLVVRQYIPAEESMSHAGFQLGALITAWVWSDTMISRLRYSLWKSVLVNCGVWGAVVVSAVAAPIIFDLLLSLAHLD